jgi:AraC-like DNA-binding protein
MRFHQFKPAAPLDRYIECFWYLETGPEPGPVQRIVPDGSLELIIHAGAPFAQIKNGVPETQPEVLFSGQITRPLFVAPQPHGRVFGIRFFPQAASALLRVPLFELTDRLLPLDSISPRLHDDLIPILDLPTSDSAFTAITHWLNHRFSALKAAPVVDHIARRIQRERGNISISELSSEYGLSSRQLQRLFAEHVGIAPKTLCRIARFQHVLNLLQNNGDRWADVAVDAGYYDQSHLLLDFRQFAAETPTFLLSPETDLAEHFVRHHALSDFSKTACA